MTEKVLISRDTIRLHHKDSGSNGFNGYKVIEVDNRKEYIQSAMTEKPDVLVQYMLKPDFSLITDIELMRKLLPEALFIGVLNYPHKYYIAEMLRAGVLGYLLITDIEELSQAVKYVSKLNIYISGKLRKAIAHDLLEMNLDSDKLFEHINNDHIRNLLDHVGNGKTVDQISSDMAISEQTVKSLVETLFINWASKI